MRSIGGRKLKEWMGREGNGWEGEEGICFCRDMHRGCLLGAGSAGVRVLCWS